jgi:DNA-binding GntR family transcriptional regulator
MSLATNVYQSIRTDIIDGSLLPGTPLIESNLAESLGVSRTPIREALRRLADDGLVDILHGHGARVSQILYSEILEAHEIRELVEPHEARKAALNPSLNYRERLRAMRAEISKVQMDNTRLRREADWRLHDIILEGAGNEVLRKLIWDLRMRTERAFAQVAGDQLELRRQEHLHLLDMVISGDADGAEEAMRQHLALAGDRVMDFNGRTVTIIG